MCEICSKLTIKTPEPRHWRRTYFTLFHIFPVNFERISHFSDVSIVDFKQINTGWVAQLHEAKVSLGKYFHGSGRTSKCKSNCRHVSFLPKHKNRTIIYNAEENLGYYQDKDTSKQCIVGIYINIFLFKLSFFITKNLEGKRRPY